jgi:Mn2+/Fe2+ NRAMP family transporter
MPENQKYLQMFLHPAIIPPLFFDCVGSAHPAKKGYEHVTSQISDKIVQERQMIVAARNKGKSALLKTFVKLSGPGWMQSAITLGGGSLAGSLYLGVLGGVALLWLQPLAMIMGVIMLSAISYVTLSTGQRPFQAINKHVNPVLGWGWALATLMANIVWSLPQFSLGAAAIRQNLLPGLVGGDAMAPVAGKLIACGGILAVCITVVMLYDTGSKGVKLFEILLKLMVWLIVICFFGVVIKISLTGEGPAWNKILGGFIPDTSLCYKPVRTFLPFIDAVEPQFQKFWHDFIVSQQRDVMITAAATAVGINMTFLLPYSMLKRGWDRNFRSLAIFDLSTGLFIPFVLAINCVLIASATQFHTKAEPGFLGETDASGQLIKPSASMMANADERIKYQAGTETFAGLTEQDKENLRSALPEADRQLAAMLTQRDAFSLAQSLGPLTGAKFSQYTFGIGVLGMVVSTVIILMLINGFVICEILGKEPQGWLYRLGCLIPGLGFLGPFFWKQAAFWLAVPTSIFGMVLLPIAYFTFFFVMNQKSLLGDDMPRGRRRVIWNVLMLVASGLAAFGSVWSIWSKLHFTGIGIIVGFIVLALIVHIIRATKTKRIAK